MTIDGVRESPTARSMPPHMFSKSQKTMVAKYQRP